MEYDPMKALLLTLGMIGFLSITTQLFRHAYLTCVAPKSSVLEKYDDKTDKDNTASLSIEELTKQYDDVRAQIKVLNAGKTEQDKAKANIWEEPFKSEDKLRAAIQMWESRNREMMELHFFWWCGALCIVLGLIGFWKGNRWLAVALLATGFVEMIYWTSPPIRIFGSGPEFEQLVTWKLIYTTATLVLFLMGWVYLNRVTKA
jgi:hypothetical protein